MKQRRQDNCGGKFGLDVPTEKLKPRHVVFATDDGGFLPLMVSVRSLLASADASRPLRVSVLTGCGALARDHEAALARQAAEFR